MPIFEYACKDCGTNFEKLVRNGQQVECPGCGQNHLEQQYSTFAARAEGSAGSMEAACEMPSMGCGSGMCGAPGYCNRN